MNKSFSSSSTTYFTLILIITLACQILSQSVDSEKSKADVDMTTLSPLEDIDIEAMKQNIKDVFYHGWKNYLQYAFPHDELKPLSKSYTDSFVELGNIDVILSKILN